MIPDIIAHYEEIKTTMPTHFFYSDIEQGCRS